MILKSAEIMNHHFVLETADIKIEDGRILRVEPNIPFTDDELVIDCTGYYIVPGFVDIHIHGCAGADTSDGTREAIEAMSSYLVTKGVTTFCPTTMSSPPDTLRQAVRTVRACMEVPCSGAAVAGINMEGPFLSAERKGAHLKEYLMQPDIELFRELYDLSGGGIKLVDLAPEEDPGFAFIQAASALCTVSIAHTTANYSTACDAFRSGISHATHLFNSMSGLSHRAPGAVGAVLDSPHLRAELICDGHHIHPAVLRIAFRILGDRAVIVSDAMRAAGLPESEPYTLGGQSVSIHNGKATLSNGPDQGTLAGSVTNLHEEIKNLIAFGIPFPQAIQCATAAPAKAIGLYDSIGSIEPGKKADLVVLDQNYDIAAVYH